ncbi:MAG: ABC transporter ATP-binding protein [Promethearchaeota archaeon]|nr:MAG: ABC transporter ATP-binding protein [Candidatus Lokiarchaeota archaeon]
MDLIHFKNFSYRYKGNEEYALDGINLQIQEDKFILLCGETGSGKTSLIRCMNGLIPQFYAGFYKGCVEIEGVDTTKTTIADLSTKIGVVFQNPENQLISMNVEHEIAFGLENLGVPKGEITKRIANVVKLTEIEHLTEKAPFELSGGEQQRVALASILALHPKVLILDEPTALLDPYMAEKIIKLIKKIQAEQHITVIISEHRLDLIMPFVDEIILIDQGKIVEHDTKQTVLNGSNFKNIRINHPIIYNLFTELRQENLFQGNVPSSIPEAVKILKSYGKQRLVN